MAKFKPFLVTAVVVCVTIYIVRRIPVLNNLVFA